MFEPTFGWLFPGIRTYTAFLAEPGAGPPRELFLVEGRVAVEPGTRFGARGPGFMRLNFATSAEILDDAISRMAAVCEVVG